MLKKFFRFIKQLLIARWRGLLLLFLGIYLPLQTFTLLAIQVRENSAGFPWDQPILLAIHQTSRRQLDVLAVNLTNFGSIKIVFPIVLIISLILLFQKKWRSLTFLVTTALGATIINRTVKEIMHRVRPHLWQSPAPELDYAFPSGHAMTSMTLVAALVILTWGTIWCLPILIFGSLFVLAIGWTRLYLGVHFPSDILAGWAVAVAWAMGVSLLIKPQLPKAITTSKPAQPEIRAETSLLPEEQEAIDRD
ncbi:phosphatase PAP2 family protein [Phormidium sp. LEGE 05292]|uniref:phosphatase PAP2 family protein n=1 Tax=[Phormidium] sp. LEGE 05292 TaxID=767427 RepID=UPI00187E44CA|nr:phosphatase PAP2 family protein [Phormidium sp. LEGE 05292]MBE9226453.1 phosphatase PAP2 family protein [Phormidium sp. LEGE 05292]